MTTPGRCLKGGAGSKFQVQGARLAHSVLRRV
jgi:hypothetical protein